MQWSVITWRGASQSAAIRSASGLVLIGSSLYKLACTAKSAAGGFIGRQPVTPTIKAFKNLYLIICV
jgi:hypothetical protein